MSIGLAPLREIARAIATANDLDTTLDLIAHKTTEVMGVDSCTIYLLDPDQKTLRLRASTGLARRALGRATLTLGEGLTGYAVQNHQPAFARYAQHDPRFKFIHQADEKRFASLLAVPMSSEGHTIGAMNVQTLTPRDFGEEEIELLALIGDLAAGALNKAALYDSLTRQVQELSTLARVSEAVTSPIYLNEMLDVVTKMAAQVMRAAVCSIYLLDEASGKLEMRSAQRLEQIYAPRAPMAVGQGISGRVAKLGKPLVVADVRRDKRYINRALAKQEGLVAMLSVPLVVREKVIGVLNCFTTEPRKFSKRDIALFFTLANQTALALENARLVTNAAIVREMHHRIKNNLQTVAMLMRLQVSDQNKLSAQDVLHQSINRIQAIAAVHEVLSEQGFRLVDAKDVITRIARMTAQNMIAPAQQISLSVEGEALILPSRPATSLALVVNELTQNALEHAFVKRKKGQVIITLAHTTRDYFVTVADDGIGLPAKIPSSLGLEIVETLVRDDLKGKMKFKRGKRGTQVELIIPRKAIKEAE